MINIFFEDNDKSFLGKVFTKVFSQTDSNLYFSHTKDKIVSTIEDNYNGCLSIILLDFVPDNYYTISTRDMVHKYIMKNNLYNKNGYNSIHMFGVSFY